MDKIIDHKEIDLNDFKLIEKHYGTAIPDEVISFICKYNGQIKNDLPFNIPIADGKQIQSEIHFVCNTQEIIETLEYINYLEVYQKDFELKSDYVEAKTLFPILELLNGSIFISIKGMHTGKLYYADDDLGIVDLKLSLSDIIELLENH